MNELSADGRGPVQPAHARGASASWLRLGPWAFAALLLTAAPADAYAYLDPGTGSVLLQGLIAAVAAVATFASMFWQRTKALVAGLFGRKRRSDDDTQAGR